MNLFGTKDGDGGVPISELPTQEPEDDEQISFPVLAEPSQQPPVSPPPQVEKPAPAQVAETPSASAVKAVEPTQSQAVEPKGTGGQCEAPKPTPSSVERKSTDTCHKPLGCWNGINYYNTRWC